MSVQAYLQYHLLNLDGAGHQPYHQVAQAGMSFEGGHYARDGKILGYLSGDAGRVTDTIAALSPWRVLQLTPNEALAWAETVVPLNSEIEMPDGTRYVGAAEFDADGRVTQPFSEAPWEV